jgi:hypothetical protein
VVRTPKVSFTNDEVRETILKFLYDKWNNPRGMDSAKAKITEIKKALKTKGMEQGIVIKNLQFLFGAKFVKEVIKESQYDTGKFKIPTEKKSYVITNLGIEYFEGSSKFSREEGFAGIKIDNTSGLVIVGNNNYARQEFVDLFRSLDDLKNRIGLTSELNDQTKVDYQAEIRTIQSQLVKPNPDKSTISNAWDKLKAVGTITSLSSSIITISTFLTQHFLK